MSDNPFAAPESTDQVAGVLSGSPADLKTVAQAQKGVIVCILLYLIAVFGQFALPFELRPLLGFGIITVGLIGAFFVFRMSIKVYGIGLGILLGVLAIIPLLGLLILLMVNARATSTLKRNNIRVGLLGARMTDLANL